MRKARWIPLLAAAALAGCGVGPFRAPDAPAPSGTAAALQEGAGRATDPEAAPPPETARTEEEFDTTSAEERLAAAAPPPPPRDSGPAEVALGTTIASLGDPASPGFWAETPLVQSVRPGRLSYPETGKSVQVELRPSGAAPGSGTRVSLPAMRVLEAPLTALPELTVTGL